MSKAHSKSGLSLIRLWVDGDEDGNPISARWHGKVQQMNSCMSASFSDWTALRRLLAQMLEQGECAGMAANRSVSASLASTNHRVFP